MRSEYRAMRCTGMMSRLCSEWPAVRDSFAAVSRNLEKEDLDFSSFVMSFDASSKLLQYGW